MKLDPRPRSPSISQQARLLLRSYWDSLPQSGPSARSIDTFFPLRLEDLARQILSLTVMEQDSIPSKEFGFTVAGVLNRRSCLIQVSQKFGEDWKRFTLAHEIGHYVLHHELIMHRDRPMNGAERVSPERPKIEREADQFAAALLMPEKRVRTIFAEAFGEPVGGTRENLLKWLASTSKGSGHSELVLMGDRRSKALAIAGGFVSRSRRLLCSTETPIWCLSNCHGYSA